MSLEAKTLIIQSLFSVEYITDVSNGLNVCTMFSKYRIYTYIGCVKNFVVRLFRIILLFVDKN
jgi:hypothetical protein